MLFYIFTVVVAIIGYIYYFDIIDYLEEKEMAKGVPLELPGVVILVTLVIVVIAIAKTGLLIAAGLQMEFGISDDDEFTAATWISIFMFLAYILGIRYRAKQRTEKDADKEEEHYE